MLCRAHLGVWHWAVGRFEDAILEIRQTLEIDENFGFASMLAG